MLYNHFRHIPKSYKAPDRDFKSALQFYSELDIWGNHSSLLGGKKQNQTTLPCLKDAFKTGKHLKCILCHQIPLSQPINILKANATISTLVRLLQDSNNIISIYFPLFTKERACPDSNNTFSHKQVVFVVSPTATYTFLILRLYTEDWWLLVTRDGHKGWCLQMMQMCLI